MVVILRVALLGFQPVDDPGAKQEADDQRCHDRAAGAERQILEDVEDRELVGHRVQNMVKHRPLPSR